MEDLRTRLENAGFEVHGEDYSYFRQPTLESVEFKEVDDRILYHRYWDTLYLSDVLDQDFNIVYQFESVEEDRVYAFEDLPIEDFNTWEPDPYFNPLYLKYTTNDLTVKLGDEGRVGPLMGHIVDKEYVGIYATYTMLIEHNTFCGFIEKEEEL